MEALTTVDDSKSGRKDPYVNQPIPKKIPFEFILRRSQSLSGLFLVIFLFEHLLTNSQAALFIGDDGLGFIQMVNSIKSLPYLPLLEMFLIGFPILIHGGLGISYLFSARYNSYSTDGSKPSLPNYSRNHAYTWQRITAMVLVVGLSAHILMMRFLEHPQEVQTGLSSEYIVSLTQDPGLEDIAQKLGVRLHRQGSIVYATASDQGTAILLVVRDTFKSIFLCSLYTIFLLATVFHASNGLWTFCISWGLALNEYSRRVVRHISNLIMFVLAFWGLAAIWLTYWVNLKG